MVAYVDVKFLRYTQYWFYVLMVHKPFHSNVLRETCIPICDLQTHIVTIFIYMVNQIVFRIPPILTLDTLACSTTLLLRDNTYMYITI